MRIGYITSSLSEGAGWSIYSRGVFQFASALPNNVVVALTSKNSEVEETKRVHKVLPPHLTFKLSDQFKVLYYCLKYFRGFDIIHTCYEPPMIGAALASRLLGATYVMTIHGTYAVPPEGLKPKIFIKRQLMKFAYHTAKKLTSGSANTEKRVRRIFPKIAECRFIPNGFDPEVFKKNDRISDGKYLLTVGWLKNRKGMDVVVDALGLLKNEFPDLKYKIIGGDDDNEQSDYYKYLQKKIKDNSLENRVYIRIGKISRLGLAEEYNKCSLFILVSRDSGDNFEGFPMVYMEAQACGAPIVTTRGYGSEYVVKNGYNGFLVEQENVPQTANAIRNILKNPEIHRQMSINSQEVAREHSWPVIIKKIYALYCDALNKNNAEQLIKS
jgi:phosphatidylinositol alpha-1,6-mannosyltransferase